VADGVTLRILGIDPGLQRTGYGLVDVTGRGLKLVEAGVIRAETFRVPGWATDPMVLLSVAAWAVYLALIAGRVRREWTGRAVSWLAVTGLVLLLVIRFAAVPYLSAFHTYGA